MTVKLPVEGNNKHNLNFFTAPESVVSVFRRCKDTLYPDAKSEQLADLYSVPFQRLTLVCSTNC